MNEKIFYWFYSFAHQTGFLDKLIIFCAVYLGYVLLVGLFLTVLLEPEKKRWLYEAGGALFTGGTAWIIGVVLKVIVASPRPFIFLSNVIPLFPETNNAFPSSHATFFGGLAFYLLFTKFPRASLFLAAAILIGLARIISGIHWPIDILAGLTLGFISAHFTHLLYRRFFR